MFREPEKSPGLSLLQGAGLRQLQLLGLTLPHAPLCPCVILQGASVCVYVCDGEPSCTPLVCLSLSSILGRMVILKSLGVLGQRQAGTSPGALGLPKP